MLRGRPGSTSEQRLLLGWALIVACSLGCRFTPYKAYEGPTLPNEQLARICFLQNFRASRMVGIDDREIPKAFEVVNVLPGTHRVKIDIDWPDRPSEQVSADITTSAGHRYHIWFVEANRNGARELILGGLVFATFPFLAAYAIADDAIRGPTERPPPPPTQGYLVVRVDSERRVNLLWSSPNAPPLKDVETESN